jgi:hypothetical protein
MRQIMRQSYGRNRTNTPTAKQLCQFYSVSILLHTPMFFLGSFTTVSEVSLSRSWSESEVAYGHDSVLCSLDWHKEHLIIVASMFTWITKRTYVTSLFCAWWYPTHHSAIPAVVVSNRTTIPASSKLPIRRCWHHFTVSFNKVFMNAFFIHSKITGKNFACCMNDT